MIVMLANFSAPIRGAYGWKFLSQPTRGFQTAVKLVNRCDHSLLLRRLTLLVLTFRTDLSKTRKILGFHLRRGAVFTPDRFIDFFAMDRDLFRGVDSESNLIAANIDDGHLDVIADHDRLIALTRQHQHGGSFLGMGLSLQARMWLATSVSQVRFTASMPQSAFPGADIPLAQTGLRRLGQRKSRLEPQQRLARRPFLFSEHHLAGFAVL
jgi:hypothetical protein